MTLFKGTLPGGYIGNVTWQYELERPYEQLHILLSYRPGPSDPEIWDPYAAEAFRHHTERLPQPLEMERIHSHMKTELQLAAFLNGSFLGNVHRPGRTKEMHFIKDGPRTPGCMPYRGPYQGHLKIVMNSFWIMEKEICYELKIGEKIC